MQNFSFDLRFVLRQLRKSPGFALTAVLMLAFGIGATTAIFSIVEGVLLRPLPFPDSGRLVVLGDMLEGADLGGGSEAGVTVPDIIAYSRDTKSFTALGGLVPCPFRLFRALLDLADVQLPDAERREHDADRNDPSGRVERPPGAIGTHRPSVRAWFFQPHSPAGPISGYSPRSTHAGRCISADQ